MPKKKRCACLCSLCSLGSLSKRCRRAARLTLPSDGAPEPSSGAAAQPLRSRCARCALSAPCEVRFAWSWVERKPGTRPCRQRASESESGELRASSSSPLCEEGVEVRMTIKNASSGEAKAHTTATASMLGHPFCPSTRGSQGRNSSSRGELLGRGHL